MSNQPTRLLNNFYFVTKFIKWLIVIIYFNVKIIVLKEALLWTSLQIYYILPGIELLQTKKYNKLYYLTHLL